MAGGGRGRTRRHVRVLPVGSVSFCRENRASAGSGFAVPGDRLRFDLDDVPRSTGTTWTTLDIFLTDENLVFWPFRLRVLPRLQRCTRLGTGRRAVDASFYRGLHAAVALGFLAITLYVRFLNYQRGRHRSF